MNPSDHEEPAVCVEIATEVAEWIDDLPPAPSSGPLTVSFTSPALLERDAAAVTELGYRTVGVATAPHVDGVAHLMVGGDVVARHERWWRAVLDVASRVYDLQFGPVQHALRAVIAAHAAPVVRDVDDGSVTPAPSRSRRTPNA